MVFHWSETSEVILSWKPYIKIIPFLLFPASAQTGIPKMRISVYPKIVMHIFIFLFFLTQRTQNIIIILHFCDLFNNSKSNLVIKTKLDPNSEKNWT